MRNVSPGLTYCLRGIPFGWNRVAPLAERRRSHQFGLAPATLESPGLWSVSTRSLAAARLIGRLPHTTRSPECMLIGLASLPVSQTPALPGGHRRHSRNGNPSLGVDVEPVEHRWRGSSRPICGFMGRFWVLEPLQRCWGGKTPKSSRLQRGRDLQGLKDPKSQGAKDAEVSRRQGLKAPRSQGAKDRKCRRPKARRLRRCAGLARPPIRRARRGHSPGRRHRR
ncbi:hypothetical protein CLV29_2938 [Naumannella halotolerans]|uniref:Uncharacterized protein n=1 Tax=Naumannella halotolerans TaxID=993414 RepID=A0A4R7IYY5_9ACTN|nr:hypothetical protein CLV29_2938 [Naumannella halotolerans]